MEKLPDPKHRLIMHVKVRAASELLKAAQNEESPDWLGIRIGKGMKESLHARCNKLGIGMSALLKSLIGAFLEHSDAENEAYLENKVYIKVGREGDNHQSRRRKT